jgi:hypothetical protein
MAGPGYPSATNTYVPNHAASQALVVGYSRSPNTFRIPTYTQYIQARNNQGLYLVWTSREGARILTTDDREHNWQDGDAAPTGIQFLETMQWFPFLTRRKCYPFLLGQMMVEQAEFSLLAAQGGVSAQQAMTARTLITYTALSGAAWGPNTAVVNGGILPGGQTWGTGGDNLGSDNPPNIKISLQYGQKIINQQTIGVVGPNQTTLVVNPTTAMAMASSGEIQAYVRQSEFSMAQMRGDVPNQNGQWGLPTMLYNHPVTVEDCVRVSSRQQAVTTTIGYVVPDGVAFLLARQGDLMGIEGTRSFSTVQIFFYIDELTVFSKFDVDNLRYMGRVVSNLSPVVVSTLSGFYFTACI